MSWSGENPVEILAGRRGRADEAAVRRTVLLVAGGGLALAHALAALEAIPLLRGLWPFWTEAAAVVVLSVAMSLFVAVPFDQARRDVRLLRGLRDGACLPEILGTPLGAAHLCDGLARHSLLRGVGTGSLGALAILIGGPLLPVASLLVVPLLALGWLLALGAVQLAASYGLQLGAAWAGPTGRLAPGGDARVALALLPLPATLVLRPLGPLGLEVALALAATILLSRAGAIAGVQSAMTPPLRPAPRVRKPSGPWGEGNPLLLRRRLVASPCHAEHVPFLVTVLLPGLALAAFQSPLAACWWMVLTAVPLQTWRSASGAFEAVAHETAALRLPTLHLTALTAREFAGGLASAAWRPRLLEAAALAPLVLLCAHRAGLPLLEVAGFLLALGALTVAGAHAGVMAALDRGSEDGRRELALYAGALLGLVAMAVAQVSADVTAGEWRYAVSESRAILAITGVYVPLVAGAAALLLRAQALRVLTHSPGSPGFSPPPCGPLGARE